MNNIRESINFFFFSLVRNFIEFFSRVDFRGESSNSSDVTGLLPIIGYALVIMSFIDFISVASQFQLQNFESQLNSISAFTEHSWIFLIGLGFIFTRYFSENQYDIRFPEIIFQKIIRWIILLIGVAFFLAIPLVFVNTGRLLKSVNNQILEQQKGNLEQIAQIEKGLNSGLTTAQIQLIGRNINLTPEELKLPEPQIKDSIKRNLLIAKTRITEAANQAKRQQLRSTWKNSFRTIIALLILAFTFVIVWLKIGQVF
ncbi:HpsJ family protein [Dolichospermum circinale]|uniref:HpsJ-like protein, cyanoexosortase A-associated n=1 Tax=Dolichospermum circinale TaxID=109265 RepID=UPI0003FD8C61|nr:HpsJ family protein [Dolichospermum circinale]MDB9475715.1 HpsJ family protein [Dolichospermum circinale CS-537/11]MDB9478167.1 HpsJ family protein [Dolichospermum circinale CS-537/03]MDB9482366.1 HpsJ family protein [Dolichospermum circinale CS-537/05]